MARPRDPDLERAWRQRLRRQAASDLSIPEFCAREGISCSSFHAWKRRLATRSLPATPNPDLFVPVRLSPPPGRDDRAPHQGVEIELPHQVRVRFVDPPEPEWLGRVVAALAALPRREGTP